MPAAGTGKYVTSLRHCALHTAKECHWIEGVAMNLVLISLQIAVLLTLLFAYGRK
jgi:hypothetical protein